MEQLVNTRVPCLSQRYYPSVFTAWGANPEKPYKVVGSNVTTSMPRFAFAWDWKTMSLTVRDIDPPMSWSTFIRLEGARIYSINRFSWCANVGYLVASLFDRLAINSAFTTHILLTDKHETQRKIVERELILGSILDLYFERFLTVEEAKSMATMHIPYTDMLWSKDFQEMIDRMKMKQWHVLHGDEALVLPNVGIQASLANYLVLRDLNV